MKKIYILLIALLSLTSCEKFLDVRPVASKPDTDVLNTPANVEKVLLASYSNLQSGDLYGEKIYKVGELLGDNLDFSYITTNANGNDATFKTRDFSVFDNTFGNIWGSAYTAIYRANIVIKAVDNNTFSSSAAFQNQLKGEALFIRALMHFELVRFYALPYTNSPTTDPGVVIRTIAPSANQSQIRVPRNTVAEVYTQVIADLKSAISLLPVSNPSNPSRANSIAAQACLARVYFSMNDYVNAELYSSNVINAISFTPDTGSYRTPFINEGNKAPSKDVIFQIVNFAGSDGRGGLTNDFWNQSPSNITFSLDTLGNSTNGNNSIYAALRQYGGKRFNSLTVAVDSVKGISRPYSLKYRGDDPLGAIPINVPVIRLAEMYLTRAESRAQLGSFSDNTVRADYNVLRTIAGLPLDNTTSGQSALINTIRIERRVELVLENDRYHELRRQKSMNIRGFAYNSSKVLLIPLGETNGNGDIQQNY